MRVNRLAGPVQVAGMPYLLRSAALSKDETRTKTLQETTDLMVQNIFVPQIIIIDGLKFDEDVRETIVALQAMAKRHAMRLWFTIHVHGYEELTIDEMPARLVPLADLFDVIFKLQPEKGEICIKPLRSEATGSPALFLDAATMLIKKL
jgi:hypothetical protein